VAGPMLLLIQNERLAETTIRSVRGRVKAFRVSHPFVERAPLPLFWQSAKSPTIIE
jgi:hypothetical protein